MENMPEKGRFLGQGGTVLVKDCICRAEGKNLQWRESQINGSAKKQSQAKKAKPIRQKQTGRYSAHKKVAAKRDMGPERARGRQ